MTDEPEVQEEATEGTQVRFVGDPKDNFSGPASMSMFGLEFPKGEFVGVTDEAALKKLRNHNHFEFQGDAKTKRSDEVKDDLPQIAAGTGGLERLKEVAVAEGVDFPANTSKPKLMELIRQHRVGQGNDD